MKKLSLVLAIAIFVLTANAAFAQSGCLRFGNQFTYAIGVEAGTPRAELQNLHIDNTCSQDTQLGAIVIQTPKVRRPSYRGITVADSTYTVFGSLTQGRQLSDSYDIGPMQKSLTIPLDHELFFIPANGARDISIYVGVSRDLIGMYLSDTLIGYEARPIDSDDPAPMFPAYAPSDRLQVLAPGTVGFVTPEPVTAKIRAGGSTSGFNLQSTTAIGLTVFGGLTANGGIFTDAVSGGMTPGSTIHFTFMSFGSEPPGTYIGVMKIGNSQSYNTIQVPTKFSVYR